MMTYAEKRIDEVTRWCIDQVEVEGISREVVTKSVLENIEDSKYNKEDRQILNGVLNRLTKLGYAVV